MIRKIILAALAGVAMTLTAGASELTAAHRILTVTFFVHNHCPDLTIDNQMLNASLAFTGEDIKALTSDSNKMRASIDRSTLMATQPKINCETMYGFYGPEGTTLPGLISRQ